MPLATHPASSLSFRPSSSFRGKVIAIAGISGSGKSTMARLLARECAAEYQTEGEEDTWTNLMKNPAKYGNGLVHLSFHLIWTQLFMDARAVSETGKNVFIDTYFLKTVHSYLGKPGWEWLVSPQDPYLEPLNALKQLNERYVPNVDCVVWLDVDLPTWKRLLRARGRESWDKVPGFDESYAKSEHDVRESTLEHCARNGIQVIRFKQEFGDPKEQANRLKKLLINHNVLENVVEQSLQV